MEKPISVLLVDDSQTFLRIVTLFLRERSGGELNVVGTALGGEEGIALAQDLKPQVVLLDLVMPDLSGLEVIPRLREALPETRIVVLTLLDSDGYRRAAEAAGADGFVAKTTLSNDLLPAIHRVVQNSRNRSQ